MADKKITELDSVATAADADLLCIVVDVPGTPTTKKISKADFLDTLGTAAYDDSGDFDAAGSAAAAQAASQPVDATLTALAAYNTNGLLAQTAANTFTGRTITGTANRVTVTAGDGVSGNPTLTVPDGAILNIDEITGTTEITINESGANLNLRIEGDGDPNLFCTHATTDRIGIGTNTPGGKLDIFGGNLLLSQTNSAHGITDYAPTNAYGHLAPGTTVNGGLVVFGISDTNTTAGLKLAGYSNGDPTSQYVGSLFIQGGKRSGTGVAALGSTGRVLECANWTTGMFVVFGDGTFQLDTGGFSFATVGKGLTYKSGSEARAGNATLVGGTVTVAKATVTANTIVQLTRKTAGGTLGNLTYTLSAGNSFTINSDNALDTSEVSYHLIEVV